MATASASFTASPVRAFGSRRPQRASPSRLVTCAVRTKYKVELEHQGKSVVIDVPEGESILSVALDKGMDLPHDCKLGVCMTCPAKLISGQVEQSGSMLSEDVANKGYALLCVAVPQSDCRVATISEDELLDLQLCSGAEYK